MERPVLDVVGKDIRRTNVSMKQVASIVWVTTMLMTKMVTDAKMVTDEERGRNSNATYGKNIWAGGNAESNEQNSAREVV